MATYRSQQLELIENQGGGNSTKSIPAQERRQSLTVDYFNFNTTDDPTSALANNDLIRLVKLEKGTRMLGIRYWFEAMGSDQEADLGLEGADGSGFIDAAGSVADDPDFFTTARIDVAAAGEGDAGVLQEDNPGYVLEKDCYLTLTTSRGAGTATWAADKDFDGFVKYLKNQ